METELLHWNKIAFDSVYQPSGIPLFTSLSLINSVCISFAVPLSLRSHLHSIFDEIFNDFRKGKPISNLSQTKCATNGPCICITCYTKINFPQPRIQTHISIRFNFWFINENSLNRELIQLKTVSTAHDQCCWCCCLRWKMHPKQLCRCGCEKGIEGERGSSIRFIVWYIYI